MKAAPIRDETSMSFEAESGAATGRRAFFVWVALGVFVLAAAAICPFVGPTRLDWAQVLHWGAGAKGTAGAASASNPDAMIFYGLRLPRVLFGLVAGAALALAGAVFQALLRNDLATPYTLGISGGASVGALLVLRFMPATLAGIAGIWLLPFSSFLFAGLTVALVLGLARGGGRSSHRAAPPSTLLLAGVTLNLLFGSLILLIQYCSDPYSAFMMFRWLLGGVDVASYREAGLAGAVVAAGALVLTAQARRLNLLSMGEMTAAHLGVSVERTRLVCLGVASLMTAAVVAFSGPIGFVGLIVPHALRRVIGPDHRILLPSAAMAGAGFLVVCDAAARTVLAPSEIPVGVITSLLGAPFFLWILFRHKA